MEPVRTQRTGGVQVMISVNTNVMALNAQHNLGVTATKMAKTLEKLSSGLRINRAADDAAGLAVSEKLRSQIRGLTQASRNAQDGISLLQTAEGALNETHSIMQRMRELAVQAGTATLQGGDRTAIQAEVTQLSAELDRIANVTDFNGSKLLNGTLGGRTIANLGANITAGNGVNGIQATTANVATGYTITTAAGSGAGKVKLTVADTLGNSQSIDVTVATSGTKAVSFEQLGIVVTTNNALAAGSIVANNTFDVAQGAGSADLLIGAGIGGVSSAEILTVSIGNMNATTLFGGTIDVSTQAGAQSALATLDTAIQSVSTTRANLGALQNRLEHTIASLGVAVENLSSSESRIRDTDVAEETSRMVSAQILSQAGTSILSQANQAPQGALSLLRGG